METEKGAGGAGYLPARFTGAAMATTESNTCQHRMYGKEAAVLVGGPASAGPALAEDGHGATKHRHPQREEGGTKPRGERERNRNWPTERRRRGAPSNGRARLTRVADDGGKGEGEPPPSSARPWRAARDQEGTPRNTDERTPSEGSTRIQRGDPNSS